MKNISNFSKYENIFVKDFRLPIWEDTTCESVSFDSKVEYFSKKYISLMQ